MLEITSFANPKIKLAVNLRDRKDRDNMNLFLIEGYRELSKAVVAHVSIDTFFFCKELFLGENEEALIQTISSSNAIICACPKKIFQKISYRDRPDGLLAIAHKKESLLSDLEKLIQNKKNPFLLIAESIEKPGNLGTILRSSDAVGVDGVIVADKCTDIFNPNVVRASIGTLFTQLVIQAKGEDIFAFLKKHHIKIVAATPHAKKEFTKEDLTGPIAIAVGSEQYGLSPLWMEQADIKVCIPMMGASDSLNVATATTILLYEVLRQRRS